MRKIQYKHTFLHAVRDEASCRKELMSFLVDTKTGKIQKIKKVVFKWLFTTVKPSGAGLDRVHLSLYRGHQEGHSALPKV